MKSMKQYGWICLWMAAALLTAPGCATKHNGIEKAPPGVSPKRPEPVPPDQAPQIDPAGLELESIGNTALTAGAPAVIGVQLTNFGARDIQVKEWYMIDQYNFAVHYRRVPDDRPLAPGTPFLTYQAKILPKARRSELTLKPRNRAQFLVDLPFIGDLAPGETAEFELYVATSLHTFKIRTPVFTVITR